MRNIRQRNQASDTKKSDSDDQHSGSRNNQVRNGDDKPDGYVNEDVVAKLIKREWLIKRALNNSTNSTIAPTRTSTTRTVSSASMSSSGGAGTTQVVLGPTSTPDPPNIIDIFGFKLNMSDPTVQLIVYGTASVFAVLITAIFLYHDKIRREKRDRRERDRARSRARRERDSAARQRSL